MFWLLLSSAHTALRLFLQRSPLHPVGWGWAGSWEGTWSGQLTQTAQRAIPYHMASAQQWKLREKRSGGIHHDDVCVPEQPLRILKPCFPGSAWKSPTDGTERRNVLFSFASACSFCFIKLPLSWPKRGFFRLIFYPPCPAEEGKDRAAWWAPGVQPKSTDHTWTAFFSALCRTAHSPVKSHTYLCIFLQ